MSMLEPRTETLQIRVTLSERVRLETLARRKKVSMSALVYPKLQQVLADAEPKPLSLDDMLTD